MSWRGNYQGSSSGSRAGHDPASLYDSLPIHQEETQEEQENNNFSYQVSFQDVEHDEYEEQAFAAREHVRAAELKPGEIFNRKIPPSYDGNS